MTPLFWEWAADTEAPAVDPGHPIKATTAPVIELDAVAHLYPGPPAVQALNPTHLVVDRSDYLAITGPSGSGKSTLLNLIGLLDRPTEGRVLLDGVDTGALSETRRTSLRGRRIGFVFQSFHLLPHRTALDNVMLAGIYQKVPRRQRESAAQAALATVGLDHRKYALPRQLSGGECQRVAIARALAHEPSLLLCDEPTGNLDTRNTENLLDLLDSLNEQGITIVVITHDPKVSARAARQLRIQDGTVDQAAA